WQDAEADLERRPILDEFRNAGRNPELMSVRGDIRARRRLGSGAHDDIATIAHDLPIGVAAAGIHVAYLSDDEARLVQQIVQIFARRAEAETCVIRPAAEAEQEDRPVF